MDAPRQVERTRAGSEAPKADLSASPKSGQRQSGPLDQRAQPALDRNTGRNNTDPNVQWLNPSVGAGK